MDRQTVLEQSELFKASNNSSLVQLWSVLVQLWSVLVLIYTDHGHVLSNLHVKKYHIIIK